MNITERERNMIKAALNSGAVTQDQLFDAGYSERDIQDILTDREWRIIFGNIDDKNMIENCQNAVSDVLGSGWKDNFDYSESRKRGKYELMLYITETDFNEICEAARS